MYFCEYIHILCYIFIYFDPTSCLSNDDLKIVKTGMEPVSPCAVGFKFNVVVNNTSSLDDYDVELVPDRCYLQTGSNLDCDILEAVGNCVEKIPKDSISTLKLVAPILDPYERRGYCLAYLDSKAVHRKRNVVMRNSIKIPFDTRIKNWKRTELPSGVTRCKGFDEDPLNKCKPVDCEVFYNGKKSFYSKIQKRCVDIPDCVSEEDEIPNSVYDPISNKCIIEDPITDEDYDYIKSLRHSNKDRIVKDIVIIKRLQTEPANLTEYYNNALDKTDNSFFSSIKKQPKTRTDWFGSRFMIFVQNNKSGVSCMFIIIIMQCTLICLMIYFIAKRCMCKGGKKLEKKYFNYRQDASVTTPLIGMATVETETETTCQFMSESSHIDRKIQCYKACQKENAKFCMSDDIISKCLNRRNWDRKQVRSDAVDNKTDPRCDESKTFETLYISTKKEEQKVNFENDNVLKTKENKSKQLKSIVKKDSKRSVFDRMADDDNSLSEVCASEREINCVTYKYKDSKSKNAIMNTEDPRVSEKEIKCHSYNYGMVDSDHESLKASSHSYSDVKSTSKNVYTTQISKAISDTSIGRQVSAQACFSNDSIDDYLSERGVFFLTGENISKYSFSEGSIKSSVSSRTSKNNIMKHVLSYIKRDKHGPSSDPGGKKCEEEVNLELIHMSKATMYSSSNNEMECLKNLSRVKESRTSL